MEYFNQREAAEFLGISDRTMRRKQERGEVSATKFSRPGGGYEMHYSKEELEKVKGDLKETVIPAFDLPASGQEAITVRPDASGQGLDMANPDAMELVYAIAARLAEAMALSNQGRPLDCYRELEEAIEKKWLLPTSKVKELIGIKPRGEVFERGNFRFVKYGKIGSEAAWKVKHEISL